MFPNFLPGTISAGVKGPNVSSVSLLFLRLTEHDGEHLRRLPLLLLRQPPPRPLLGGAPFLPARAALPPPLATPHAVLEGGRARRQAPRSRHGRGQGGGGPHGDGERDLSPSRERRGLGGGERRSQALLGLRKEAAWPRFDGVDHRLLPQGLTHREGGRSGMREASFGGKRQMWVLVRETKRNRRTFISIGIMRVHTVLESVWSLTTFLRWGPAVAGLRIRVHNFTSSGCVHLFWKGRKQLTV